MSTLDWEVIGVIFAVIGTGATMLFAFGRWSGRAETKLDGVISAVDHVGSEIKDLGVNNRTEHVEIRTSLIEHTNRLGDHSERLVRIEEKVKGCPVTDLKK